uniref:Zmp:0000001301 n=1 Tax=Tetraodon nigroviridis TaxID=99883 RepID=H3C3E6_TETNG
MCACRSRCRVPGRSDESFALVGGQVFMLGGFEDSGDFCKDVFVLNAETLVWQKWEVKGEAPSACRGQTLTAHHDKDIYLFGGRGPGTDGALASSGELHKLSIAKMKWKVPLYLGIPPARRHGHSAFVSHSHLCVFGGRNEEQELNDLKVMKLINPSERQPVMKEILSEFGLQGVSVQRDFVAVRDEALKMIHSAFDLLHREFQKLDRCKAELANATWAFQREREAHRLHKQQQKEELQEMMEKHRSKNQAWLRARAEENDRERRELCSLREEVLREQERLKAEQSLVQTRSRHLLSILQQFKGL